MYAAYALTREVCFVSSVSHSSKNISLYSVEAFISDQVTAETSVFTAIKNIADSATEKLSRITATLPRIPTAERESEKEMKEIQELIADLIPTAEEQEMFFNAVEQDEDGNEDDENWFRDLDDYFSKQPN